MASTLLGNKRLAYIYDLLSGNVHFVKYQQDSIDQFYHKYTYDADNRIRTVETSRDQKIWEQDAKYFYYAHGPLARTEIGDNDVQGTDFAYTIQGWLKGVNSTALNTAADMGKDAKTGGGTLHLYTASDAFGFVLEYFKGDYTQINISGVNKDFMASQKNAGGYFPYYTSTPDLYNGNIRAMSTALMDTGRTKVNVLGKTYKYDQLNRIKSSYSFEKSNMHLTGGFSWIGLNSTNKWATEYNYDGNGNIMKHRRSGDSTVLWTMDSLTYYYYEGTNQLKYVHDGSASGNYNVDIDNQTDTNNYVYDAIGNLTGDDAEGIQKIKWNVYGKIESIKFTGASGKPDLVFGYDPMGNRISKKVMPQSAGDTITTYYVRDATGNTMATYLRIGYTASDTLRLSEQHIYGSSRLGMVSTSLLLSEQLDTSNIYTRLLGEKRYELSNHLGNVLAVITDRRFSIQSGATTTIAYYEPDVLAAQDYDPFGMITFGRSWEAGSGYRYGFNGYENTDDIYENDVAIDFGARIYDSRLSKFFSIDPRSSEYPWQSTYAYFSNNPILNVDINGEGGPEIDYEAKLEERHINTNATQDRAPTRWEYITASKLDEFTTQNSSTSGYSFEDAFARWAKSSSGYAFKNYQVQSTNMTFKAPDWKDKNGDPRKVAFDGRSSGPVAQLFDPESKGRHDFEHGKNFFEVKRYGKATMSRTHDQVGAQLNAIASNFSGATEDHAAFYFLVTTADVYDVSSVAEYAYQQGVNMYHLIPQYKILKSGDIKVRFIIRKQDVIFNIKRREIKFAQANNKGVALVL